MSFVESIRAAITARRADLHTAERLRSPLTPIVPHEELAEWQQASIERAHTTIWYGRSQGRDRVIKAYDQRFQREAAPELLPLLARGVVLGDDMELIDRSHLCLPEAIAFDDTNDRLLVAYPRLGESAKDLAPHLTAANMRALALGGANGLRSLHHAGYLHRDVTPANLITGTDAREPMWIDFDHLGLVERDALHYAIEARGKFIGTPQFMPTQSLRAALPPRPKPRSDLISFGYTLAYVLIPTVFAARPDDAAFLAFRETLRAAPVLSTAAAHFGLPELDQLIVTLTDEHDDAASYDADQLCADLDLLLAGHGNELRRNPLHRGTWRRSDPKRRNLASWGDWLPYQWHRLRKTTGL